MFSLYNLYSERNIPLSSEVFALEHSMLPALGGLGDEGCEGEGQDTEVVATDAALRWVALNWDGLAGIIVGGIRRLLGRADCEADSVLSKVA